MFNVLIEGRNDGLRYTPKAASTEVRNIRAKFPHLKVEAIAV